MILKSYLLERLNSRLQREETGIDEIIEAVLFDLTIQLPALRTEIEIDTAAETAGYDISSYEVSGIEFVTLDGKGISKISYEDYLERLGDETGSAEPAKWCYHEHKIYLTSTPDDVYAVKVFSVNWSMDEDSINLPDYFKPVLANGVCAEYMDDNGGGTLPDAILYKQKYQTGVDKIAGMRTNLTATGTTTYSDGL